MTLGFVLLLLLMVVFVGMSVLWFVMRPAKPTLPVHDDLRRADDGGEPDPGQGLGSASYWP